MHIITAAVLALLGWIQLTRAKELQLDLSAAKDSLFSMLNLIHQRFEFDDPFYLQLLFVTLNMDANAWKRLKEKFIEKIVLRGQARFRMVFGGSSVTAGHDNYYNQSYPFVLERRMRSIFEALNIDLQVHNIAQGANDCWPYTLCYENGGFSPDFISWEQSFNCGRSQDVFETLMRTAARSSAILFFHASGSQKQKDCSPSDQAIPPIDESWRPNTANNSGNCKSILLPEVRVINYLYAATLCLATNHFYTVCTLVQRFLHPEAARYPEVGAHGLAIWGDANKRCIKSKSNSSSSSALLYTSCVSAELLSEYSCSSEGGPHYHTAEMYSFANGRSSSHHPSIGNHLLRGEFMAYIYGHVLLDAIYSIEEVSAEKNEEVASNGSILVLEILKASSLSEVPLSVVPKSCHPSVCLHHARCYNNYFPHFETTSRSLESILLPLNSSSQWELRDNAALKSNPYHYQDHRAGFETSTPNVSIHFMVNITVAKSDIVVCGNENIQHAEVFVSIEETFLRRSGNCKSEINKLVRETWPPSKKFCIALKKDSYGLYFSPGEYVISICLGNSASTGASLLRITHVISF